MQTENSLSNTRVSSMNMNSCFFVPILQTLNNDWFTHDNTTNFIINNSWLHYTLRLLHPWWAIMKYSTKCQAISMQASTLWVFEIYTVYRYNGYFWPMLFSPLFIFTSKQLHPVLNHLLETKLCLKRDQNSPNFKFARWQSGRKERK